MFANCLDMPRNMQRPCHAFSFASASSTCSLPRHSLQDQFLVLCGCVPDFNAHHLFRFTLLNFVYPDVVAHAHAVWPHRSSASGKKKKKKKNPFFLLSVVVCEEARPVMALVSKQTGSSSQAWPELTFKVAKPLRCYLQCRAMSNTFGCLPSHHTSILYSQLSFACLIICHPIFLPSSSSVRQCRYDCIYFVDDAKLLCPWSLFQSCEVITVFKKSAFVCRSDQAFAVVGSWPI